MALRDMLPFGRPSAGEPFSPLSQAQKDRQKLFAQFWAYYLGRHHKPLKVHPNQTDDNVILNYAKRNVNKSVQFLFGKEVTFETDNNNEQRTPEEEYLDLVWGEGEEKSMLLQKVGLNGSVTGTPVVRLYEPVANEYDGLPCIVNIDPSILDVVTHADDVEDILGYHLTWKSGDTWKRHCIDVQQDDTWFVTVEVLRPNGTTWQEIEGSAAWPYTFAPIITAQNLPMPNQFWGISDLEDADINDAINFTASNIARILKFHAHPKTIGIGFNANDLQNTAVDEMWSINVEGATVSNLEMQSDLASAFNFLNALKTAYAKISNVPDLDPAVVNVGALSGFALRILYGDLTEMTAVKRNTYGAMLKEINKRILHLGGKGEYNTVEVQNSWLDALPTNDKEQAEALQIDKANGLSSDTYLTKRGYDPEHEKELSQADQAAQAATLAQAMTNQQRAFDQQGNRPLPAAAQRNGNGRQ